MALCWSAFYFGAWVNCEVIFFLNLYLFPRCSYPGFFDVVEPGGGGISLIIHPKLTKLGTIVDCDKLYFILVVKVLNWL